MIPTRSVMTSLLAGASALSITQPSVAQSPLTKPDAVLLSSPAPVGSLALSAGPKRAVAACGDGKLRFWDFSNGQLKSTIPTPSPNSHIDFIALSPDAHWIFAGDHDGSATVWDGESSRIRLHLQLPHYPSTAVFSRDNKLLAIATMGAPPRSTIWPQPPNSPRSTPP